ncbi:MAG: hypothetical protein ABEI32_08135, partial [Halothece sp.]
SLRTAIAPSHPDTRLRSIGGRLIALPSSQTFPSRHAIAPLSTIIFLTAIAPPITIIFLTAIESSIVLPVAIAQGTQLEVRQFTA